MPCTVLLIDDSEIIRALMRGVLEHEQFEVVEAADGEQAIELLDGRDIDVIVCDLQMPRMDGLSLMRWLRLHPRYKLTPLLVLSTETRPHMKQAAQQQGAQGFIAKPCTPTQLLEAVRHVCRKRSHALQLPRYLEPT
jgi:two-component system chemotaxis response regulator CheY